MGDMDDLVKEFLVESYENLDQLDRDFVSLESDPSAAREKLASIFRTIHTIKGTSGCLGYGKLERVAHVGENLLSRLRDGELIIDSEITTGLLRLVDAIRQILGSLETTGAEGDADYTEVSQALVRLNERPSVTATLGAASPAITAPAISEPVFEPAAPEPHVHHDVESAHHNDAATGESDRRQLTRDEASYDGPERRAAAAAAAGESVAANAIRVDVGLLDKLMNLVGELVLARNQVLQYTAAQKETNFLRTAQRLNLITTELQEGVMKTRMQPIGNLWNKFPRIVRDVATNCQKKVRLDMDGKETELDKTIIEAIKDPLTHVIRNSIDHGVETPDKRRAAGKDEEGRIHMRAFHEGGQVNIEITDDGKGIDPAVVKRKALEKGLISADRAARMGEREAVNLIFLPGFSTAEKVTNVSGRGVGMDVVKTNIEKIGGTVDVQTRVGQGTVLRIKIPLTLAIIPALVVTSGGERFAIPQVSLLELVRIDEDDPGVELINGVPLYRLRGNLLPLVYLNRELKIGGGGGGGGERATAAAAAAAGKAPAAKNEAANIVVLRGGERQFGLVVDHINDTEEIVVKPLAKQLKGISVFAGATIMGDGKVALILDVMGLAHKANVLLHGNDAAAGDRESQRSVDTAAAVAAAAERQQLLLFKLQGGARMAMPLSAVSRLEELPRTSLEDAGGQLVVQYRGQIMPLVNVAHVLGDRRAKARARRVKKDKVETESIQVVVYAHEDRHVGLLVEQILDVVDQRLDVQSTAARPGVLGTAVIKERVTELLDVQAVVRAATAADGAERDDHAARAA
jgi:two-component system chemotaxis sensor kinase CheA